MVKNEFSLFKTRSGLLWLALIVLLWYLGLSYLPLITGWCLDGDCGGFFELFFTFAIPIAFFAVPVLLEMFLYRKDFGEALGDLGLKHIGWRGIAIAIIYLVPLMFFYPLFAAVQNVPLALQPGWGWLVLRAFMVNGLVEETMMRGFVFRRLRVGRTFWRGAALSTVYFAGYHIPLIFTSEQPIIGIVAVIVAIPLGMLTAYLYERGNNSLWGAIVLHTVYNSLAFIFALPGVNNQPIALSIYLTLGIVVSSAMLAWVYFGGYGQDVGVEAA